MTGAIPHLRIIVGATIAAIFGYAGFSIYVMAYTNDAALQGDVVGTWKSFAVLAFGFWLGSSSGGKARTEEPNHTMTAGNVSAEASGHEGESDAALGSTHSPMLGAGNKPLSPNIAHNSRATLYRSRHKGHNTCH